MKRQEHKPENKQENKPAGIEPKRMMWYDEKRGDLMDKTVVYTEKAPAAIGPYVQAVKAGDMLFTSGQLGIDPATGLLREGVGAQTQQSLCNIDAILTEAGLTRADVIKTTVFLAHMQDFALVNQIYADYFGDCKPARSCVEVGSLPKGGLVEIEVIACKI